MKTLRLIYVNGRYDIDVVAGRSVTLDSTNPADRRTILAQRFEKILRSSQSFFDSDYGADLPNRIGTKKTTAMTRIIKAMERVKAFFRKTASLSGNTAIQNVVVTNMTGSGTNIKVAATAYASGDQTQVSTEVGAT